MPQKAPPEVELKWPNGSFRAVGGLALFLLASVVISLGIAWLAVDSWAKILG